MLIYILSVLGSYEFEIPKVFLNKYGVDAFDLNTIVTAKEIENNIFVAHRSVSNFIANYIETEYNLCIPTRIEIISDYINFIDNKKKWKALLHHAGYADR